jgi:hypothetical protein
MFARRHRQSLRPRLTGDGKSDSRLELGALRLTPGNHHVDDAPLRVRPGDASLLAARVAWEPGAPGRASYR